MFRRAETGLTWITGRTMMDDPFLIEPLIWAVWIALGAVYLLHVVKRFWLGDDQ